MTAGPRLFEPLTIGSVTLPNRIAQSPMTTKKGIDGVAQDFHLQHYGCFAASAVGHVTVELTAVSPEGRLDMLTLGLYNDAQEAALARLVAGIRGCGPAKISIQLFHAGRKGSVPAGLGSGNKTQVPIEDGGWETVAPSPLPFRPLWRAPKAADAAERARLQAAWAGAAARAARAGVDMIELHSAHGFGLHDWLSPLSNQRTDDYGGALANRMRYPLEVIRAVRGAIPTGMPLGIRVSFLDGPGGSTPEEALTYVKAAKDAGIDFVCVSAGGSVSDYFIPQSPGYLVPYAEQVKQQTGLAVRVSGLIVHPTQAEEIVAAGKADFIALARALLDDPRWAWRAAEILGAPPPQAEMWGRIAPGAWPGAAMRPRIPAA